MKKNIIAISREFGSGGRTIGRLVAQKLGIQFYDRDIIKKVVEESGLTRKYVAVSYTHLCHCNIGCRMDCHIFTRSNDK